MLTWLKGLVRPAPSFDPVAPDRPVYAIGDVHGRVDLLMRLMEDILADAGAFEGRPEVVYLGDYIDRGEETRSTLDFMMETARWDEIEVVLLIGNHEQMLLNFLGDPTRGPRWMAFGGLQTLMSYGVHALQTTGDEAELTRIRDALAEAMGPHVDFLEEARLSHLNGNLIFVHAGADPALALEAQHPGNLLWGHEDFGRVPRADGRWVVHGHTVVAEPVAAEGRISVDTGAYFTDRLTAARITPGAVRFLTAESAA